MHVCNQHMFSEHCFEVLHETIILGIPAAFDITLVILFSNFSVIYFICLFLIIELHGLYILPIIVSLIIYIYTIRPTHLYF